jgi:hypothetical protein
MRRTTIGCILAVLLAVGSVRAFSGAAAEPVASAPSGCGPSCRAAYLVIARALPEDHSRRLAHAIVGTSSFDYGRLARALRIPTAARLHAQWRRRCAALYPGDPAGAGRCYALILPSTYRYLGAIPAFTA